MLEKTGESQNQGDRVKIPCAFGISETCDNDIQHKYIKCLIEHGEEARYDFEICGLCLEASKVGILMMIFDEIRKINRK